MTVWSKKWESCGYTHVTHINGNVRLGLWASRHLSCTYPHGTHINGNVRLGHRHLNLGMGEMYESGVNGIKGLYSIVQKVPYSFWLVFALSGSLCSHPHISIKSSSNYNIFGAKPLAKLSS